ncbi:MAG: arginyltransferase [Micavibrio sp.]|nr:arginyltransferase [Micavibrio sp.]
MQQKRGVIWIHEESNCSYKPGEMAKIFAIHADRSAAGKKELFSELLPQGFMAARYFAFAPDCKSCNACVPLRIRTDDYKFSKSDKVLFRHNDGLTSHYLKPGLPVTLTSEHFDLFRKHSLHRLPAQGQEKWDNTVIRNYLEGHSGLLDLREKDGALVASVIFNYLDKGVAPYYVIYDPEKSGNRASLGTLCLLKMIEHSKNENPGPVYLGHWVDGANKLNYKKRFRNLEALIDTGWHDFDPAIHLTGGDYRKAIPSSAEHMHITP